MAHLRSGLRPLGGPHLRRGGRRAVISGWRLHASQNVAKKILEWEYGIEIVRTRLLMRTEEQRHASSCDTVSSHQGTCL